MPGREPCSVMSTCVVDGSRQSMPPARRAPPTAIPDAERCTALPGRSLPRMSSLLAGMVSKPSTGVVPSARCTRTPVGRVTAAPAAAGTRPSAQVAESCQSRKPLCKCGQRARRSARESDVGAGGGATGSVTQSASRGTMPASRTKAGRASRS